MNSFDQLHQKFTTDKPLLGFQNLMRLRVRNILLVSSVYDSFILAQDGQLNESMISEYMELNLQNAPVITRVSSGKEAMEALQGAASIDLIIITLHLGDMHAMEFVRLVRQLNSKIPVVLLAYNMREVIEITKGVNNTSELDKIFLWQGDFRILLAIVKYFEDRWNVDHDTEVVGVQSIILIEDDIKFYSSFLPTIYAELMKQSQSLLVEGLNMAHKQLRMRARPKILLCSDFETAWQYYESYEENILGIISDVSFPVNGEICNTAGPDFARMVKNRRYDVPIVLQSSKADSAQYAEELQVAFIQKHSPIMLNQLRMFMLENFGFGDFVFRMPDGTEVARVRDMRSMRKKLADIPEESLLYHGERDHFSNWFRARTEFELAEKLKPHKVSEYKTLEDLRKYLIYSLEAFQESQGRGTVSDFNPETFDKSTVFALIGGGSLGGKARGLAFVDMLLENFNIINQFKGVKISVPPTVVIGSNVFDTFMEINNLWDFAIQAENDHEIRQKFLEANFPDDAADDLVYYLKVVKYPLAVRSSSLLEDSQYLPFAGIYETYMLNNNHEDLHDRLRDLIGAIKLVYASTYYKKAKAYIEATPYRIEEEKMAVVLQKVVGSKHDGRFYPDFAGVARSHNHYPTPPLKSTDGIAAVCLGLGNMVMEGGIAVHFSPAYPKHLMQFSSVEDILDYSQKKFYALDMNQYENHHDLNCKLDLNEYGLNEAEEDQSLGIVGSVYSPENDAVFDGLSRPGTRLVTFAPILKHNLFPLAKILRMLTHVGYWGMSTPVEIEFAVNYSVPAGSPKEFGFLQMRPLVMRSEIDELDVNEDLQSENLLCSSMSVLGNGIIDYIRDIVVVDIKRFDRADSRQAADEVGKFNASLLSEGRPYLLIGVGRWGSADPWLGIPVSWDQISGVRVIVETSFRDLRVASSQGSHFFQNITSLMIGYFTINTETGSDFIDWEWLTSVKTNGKGKYVKHIELKKPLIIKMNGYQNKGVILRPEVEKIKTKTKK